MKIGILTFHKVINYGALLQAYALNKKIRALGFECEDIDYTSKEIADFYNPFKLKRISDLKDLILHVMTWPWKIRTSRKFSQFVKENIPLSEINYDNNISDAQGTYDILIAGSDQVWNYSLTGADSNYMLAFDDKAKKISYAGSFGKTVLSTTESEDAAKYLRLFSHISVREASGKELVDKILKCNQTRIVLDPVFLLEKNEWVSIGDLPFYDNYILLFVLHKNKTIVEFAKKLSNETGKQIIQLSNKINFDMDITYSKGCGPKDFIGLINRASYVVTDSFHATSMSIILNKQFYVGLKKQKLASLNTRIYSLLDMFGLQNRIIGSIDSHNNEEIDYTEINEVLSQKRKESVDYLIQIITN